MTTTEFNQFLIDQRRADNEERAKIVASIDAVKADIASIHRSRHETQENLSIAINEMRLDQAATEKNLAALVASVTELVAALKGNTFGSVGLVAQVADHSRRLSDIETAQKEARGMSRIIGWGVTAIGVAVGVKSLTK